MKKWKTRNGCEIIRILRGRSNAYLVITKDFKILVDTGKSNYYVQLSENLRRVNSGDRAIDYLVLTHTHYDHCQNAASLKEKYGCKIVVGASEASYTQQAYTPLPKGTSIPTKIISNLGRIIGRYQFGYKPFEADIKIDDTYQLSDEAHKIILFPTPGHSGGSICLSVDDEIALVGDTMFRIFKNSIFPPFADNVPELIKSWNLLLDTSCHTFLPGHGIEISREFAEKEVKRYV